MSQEFAWQFYVGLATLITERHDLESLQATPELANQSACVAATHPDIARWDDDGGAPRSQRGVSLGNA